MIMYKCDACNTPFPSEPDNGSICPLCCSDERTRPISEALCGNCDSAVLDYDGFGCEFYEYPHGRPDDLPVALGQKACGNWDPRTKL